MVKVNGVVISKGRKRKLQGTNNVCAYQRDGIGYKLYFWREL